jgi:hypothetical protein
MSKAVSMLWSRWILFLSLFLILYGLAMVFAPGIMTNAFVAPLLFHTQALQQTFGGLSEGELFLLNVLNGLLGTVTIGYGVLIGCIAVKPFRKGERWAWNTLTVSITAWALAEACFKWAAGLGLQSMAHFGLLLAFAIPLWKSYSYFYTLKPRNASDLEHKADV